MNCSPFFRIAFYAVFLKKSSAPLNVYCNHSTQRPRQWPSQKKRELKWKNRKVSAAARGVCNILNCFPKDDKNKRAQPEENIRIKCAAHSTHVAPTNGQKN